MKIKIEQSYGIRNKIEINSNDKKNLVVFAPNGTGKTSLRKSIDDILNGKEYEGMINSDGIEDKNEVLLEINGERIKSGTINTAKIKNKIIDSSRENHEFLENLKTVLAEDEIDEKGELEDSNIKSIWKTIQGDKYITYPLNTSEIINQINELKKIDIKDENIQKIDKWIDDAKKIMEASWQIDDSKKFHEYGTAAISGNEHQEGQKKHILDIEIIKDIQSKKGEQQDDFAYKYKDDKYIPISRIPEFFWSTKLYNKNELNFLWSIAGADDKILSDFRNKNMSFNQNISIKRCIKKIWEEKLPKFYKIRSALKLNEIIEEYEEYLIKYNKKNKSIIKKMNSKIKKINRFFNKKTLDWTIKINQIKSLNEEINLEFNFDNEKRGSSEFMDYASSGQKRVIILIAEIIEFYKKECFIVIDDPFTSLDNHHINEVLEVLSSDTFEKCSFLILTHNFEWARSMSFNSKFSQKSEFIILDKITKDECKVIACDRNEMINLMTTKSIINNYPNNINIKIIATILNISREVLGNNIQIKSDSEDSHIQDIIQIFDKTLRHYKQNQTLGDLKKNIEEKINPQILKSYPAIEWIRNNIPEIDSKKPIGELILEEPIEWNEIDGLQKYIIFKSFYGLKIRHLSEKKKYYSEKTPKEATQKWESEDEWQKANKSLPKELQEITNYKTNYLAHANNIQWTKIIEMPIYKIKKIEKEILENE